MVTMDRNKVVIVGTGRVGATAAFGIVTHGLCNDIVRANEVECSYGIVCGIDRIYIESVLY